MTDARIEALIADFKSYVGDYPGKRIDWTVEIEPMRALIASWRERGEALKEIAKFSPSARARRTAERALKDKP